MQGQTAIDRTFPEGGEPRAFKPITRRKSTVSNREVEHSQYLMVDSKAMFLYRKVDYSQYLVVDSKAEYLHREVVLYREAACPYKEVDHCQYLVVDSKVV